MLISVQRYKEVRDIGTILTVDRKGMLTDEVEYQTRVTKRRAETKHNIRMSAKTYKRKIGSKVLRGLVH